MMAKNEEKGMAREGRAALASHWEIPSRDAIDLWSVEYGLVPERLRDNFSGK